jgi:hypothetical protein
MSRTDKAKVRFGPAIHAIEDELYKHSAFIKHVPVPDRPRVIREALEREGAVYAETDFTSFEAHFLPEITSVAEYALVEYMLRGHDTTLVRDLKKAMTMKQVLVSKHATLKVHTRCSGDMWTSLGNGFTNFMLIKFFMAKRGWDSPVFVEGDDGLLRVDGPWDPVADFATLGFTIKSKVVTDLSSAGFCGIYCAPGTDEVLIEPASQLLKLGWTTSACRHGGAAVQDSLMLSKGFSLVAVGNATPVLGKLGAAIVARYGHARRLPPEDWWDRFVEAKIDMDAMLRRCQYGATPEAREFVSRKWGLSVAAQLEAERYIESWDGGPIECDSLNAHLAESYPHTLDMWQLRTHTDGCSLAFAN